MKVFLILFSFMFLSSKSENECEFQRPPKTLWNVAKDVKRPLIIRFTLKVFDEFCFFKVATPDGTFVTFNLTKREDEDKSYFPPDGDLVGMRGRIKIDSRRQKLIIDNTLKTNTFSDLSGRYQIIEKELFVLPFTNEIKQEVSGICEEDKNNNVNITASVETNELFKWCFEYYTEFKNTSINIDCPHGICSAPFRSENQSFFNFTMFNKTRTNYTLACRPPSTKYILKLKVINNCPIPVNSGWTTLVITLVVLIVAVLILVLFNIKNKKKIRIIKENIKPKAPEWSDGIFYSRGLLEIDTENPLGHGEFGIVYKAVLQQVGNAHAPSSPTSQLVAVKTYPPESNQGHDDLHQEGKLLSNLEYHPNIINLLAVSLDTPEFHNRVLLINELVAKGSLLELLQKKRTEFSEEGENWTEDFNPEVMTLWSFQISRGMKFLSMQNIIHGDLAARNILLDENSSVKINDFGKAHKVNYDNIGVEVTGVQPLAWMAPETIQKQEVSLLNDIWAFGITLWEIFTLGKHPYEEKSFQEMVTDLHNGYRLPQPDLCPGKIYSLMRDCWKEEPEMRPPWGDLTVAMEEMVEVKYLDKYWKIEDINKKTYTNIRNYSMKAKGGKDKTYNRDVYDSPPLNDDTIV